MNIVKQYAGKSYDGIYKNFADILPELRDMIYAKIDESDIFSGDDDVVSVFGPDGDRQNNHENISCDGVFITAIKRKEKYGGGVLGYRCGVKSGRLARVDASRSLASRSPLEWTYSANSAFSYEDTPENAKALFDLFEEAFRYQEVKKLERVSAANGDCSLGDELNTINDRIKTQEAEVRMAQAEMARLNEKIRAVKFYIEISKMGKTPDRRAKILAAHDKLATVRFNNGHSRITKRAEQPESIYDGIDLRPHRPHLSH